MPLEPKRVYLIRHGESLGQLASKKRRTTDWDLIDCGLSSQGEFQATNIPSLLGSERYGRVCFVVSSPLTRAVQTSVLGFPTKNIAIHYDLGEIGGIPENRPRCLKKVLADTGGEERVNGTTFATSPAGFPKSHRGLTGGDRKERLKGVWPRLWTFCQEQNCEEFAIVCHHNIIKMALTNHRDIQPKNAIPIECILHSNGHMEVVKVLAEPLENLSDALGNFTEANRKALGEYDDDDYMVND